VNRDHQEKRGLKVKKETLVPKALRVSKGLRETWELKALRVSKGLRETWELKALRVTKATKATKATLELKDPRDLLERLLKITI
jgi:hypothetical protein